MISVEFHESQNFKRTRDGALFSCDAWGTLSPICSECSTIKPARVLAEGRPQTPVRGLCHGGCHARVHLDLFNSCSR